MTGANNDVIVKLANDFNASQKDYKVVPSYKGSYPDTMNAGIAAFRAGNAPHIMQVFEVGTATMMSATGAVKPVHVLMKEAGETFDPKVYLPTITGYYSTTKGEMLSFPFNSSSTVMWYNKDSFKKAGLDPNSPPEDLARSVRGRQEAESRRPFQLRLRQCLGDVDQPRAVLVLAQRRARHQVQWHDGWDTELKFNTPLHVKHLENLVELQKDKTYDYSGRTNTGEGRFTSGECAIFLTSSASSATSGPTPSSLRAKRPMPYYPEVAGAPQNSIIGGPRCGSWAARARRVQGRRQVLHLPVRHRPQVELHKKSGYLPITKAAYEKTKASGYYKEFPYLETPLLELTNKEPDRELARAAARQHGAAARRLGRGDRGGAVRARRRQAGARRCRHARQPDVRQFERTVSR
jgi:sn-glycerol 3-phosphate transport system substrate-binding protein